MNACQIVLKGIDTSQLRFGKFPYVLFDTGLQQIVKRLGRFRNGPASSTLTSGYYLAVGIKTYVVYQHGGHFFFGTAGEMFALNNECSAVITKKSLYRRFVFKKAGQIRFDVFYRTPLRYLVFPPLLINDLLIGGGADDWDFDFFEEVSAIVGQVSNGQGYVFY